MHAIKRTNKKDNKIDKRKGYKRNQYKMKSRAGGKLRRNLGVNNVSKGS